jgi:hypothetical protein
MHQFFWLIRGQQWLFCGDQNDLSFDICTNFLQQGLAPKSQQLLPLFFA